MSEKQTIYLIGGTTEANLAARRLQADGYRVVISVATTSGGEIAGTSGFETEVGPKDAAAMESRARKLDAVAFVDCSHPFAREASREASKAAAAAGLPCLRYTRPPLVWNDESDAASCPETVTGHEGAPGSHKLAFPEQTAAAIIKVPSFQKAADRLAGIRGRSLLTIGTRNLEPFVRKRLDFTARILPLMESLADCVSLGIEPANIIAAWPPFSAGFNRACLRKSGAKVLVTKDSGREGGLIEKLKAVHAEGATVIVVQRPIEPGAIHDLEELVSKLGSRLK